MADIMLTDLVILLNQQIAYQEALTQKLFKIESLAEVALATKFPTELTQYHYLWTLSELVQDARQYSEQAFDLLLKNRKSYLH